MSIQLTVLKASYGDSLVISGDFDGKKRNILIDGGPGETFQQGVRPGSLKTYLDQVKSADEKIDLLIITHEDQDHICGLISAFEEEGYLSDLTTEVWFNSGKLLSEKLAITEERDKQKVSTSNSTATSINDGITLEELLNQKKIKHDQIIHSRLKNGNRIEKYGCEFEILSPSAKWAEKYPSNLTSSARKKADLRSLMNGKTGASDGSPSNGASIAFNFKFGGKTLMLLGDAHAIEVIRGLKSFGYTTTKKIKVDYMKLSHHGSKNNTSKKLLNYIDCESYIVTTDGTGHGHPDKEVFARIIECSGNKPSFLFNHPELIDKIFQKDDYEHFDFVAKEIDTIPL